MRILFWQEDHPIVKGGAETWLKETAKGLKLLGHESTWLQSEHIQQAVDNFKPDVVIMGTLHAFNKLHNVAWLAEQKIPAVWFLHDYWPFCASRMLLLDHNRSDQPCEAVKGICADSCQYREKPQVLELVNRFHTATGCEGAADIMLRNGVNVRFVVEEGIDTGLFHLDKKRNQRLIYASASGNDVWKGMHILEAAAEGHFKIKFLTGLSRYQLAETLSHADIYCFPSVYEEIWGLTLTEAMASGCAVVASNVAGARAQVHEGMGYLSPPGDIQLLRDNINDLLERPNRLIKMAARGRKHIEQAHSLLAIGKRWEKVLEKVMEGR